ncbi:MAG: hypothetical protein AB1861_12855 [Cyanobacteriota bacterium]
MVGEEQILSDRLIAIATLGVLCKHYGERERLRSQLHATSLPAQRLQEI